jgi:hypothetical protein
MPAVDAKSQPALGFLTVLEHPQHGLMGGYLVLNPSGRPLEFHCTAPVKPNRAQQILYGPTLEPYLYGEQIGQALVAKSAAEPLLICTDLRPTMAVRPLVSAPVALVLKDTAFGTESDLSATAEAADAGQSLPFAASAEMDTLRTPRLRLDAAHGSGPLLQVFQIGRNRLAVTPDREGDRSEILKRLARFEDLFDLSEPFGRIREALEEAQRR